MRSWLLLALIALAWPAAPCSAQAPSEEGSLPSVTLPAELDRVLRDYERAWQGGDAAALAELFTEDGLASRPGGGWIRGRDPLRERYQGAGGDLRLRAIAFAVDDGVGYIVGAYGYGLGPEVVDGGRFVLALRRAPGGEWQIAADLDSSNRR